jgi:hypothetical protein
MQNCKKQSMAALEHANMQVIVINSQKGGSGKTMLCKRGHHTKRQKSYAKSV